MHILNASILAVVFAATSCCATAVSSCGASLQTPLPNPPYYCGSRGVVGAPAAIGATQSAGSVAACANACKSNGQCQSFAYSNSARSCQLYSKTLHDQDYTPQNAQSDAVHYNQHCFSCKSSCNAANPVYAKLNGPLSATAPAFCSSYLGYPVVTTVDVTSAAPNPTIHTRIVKYHTVTENTGSTSYVYTGTPTTITTYSTTIYTAAAGTKRVKRSAPGLLRNYPATSISAACSCFAAPSTSTTSTTVDIGPTKTDVSSIVLTVPRSVYRYTSTNTVVTTISTVVVVDPTPTTAPARCDIDAAILDSSFQYVIQQIDNTDYVSCQQACKDYPGGACLMSEYSRSICQLFSIAVAQAGLNTAFSPGFYFNDVNCPIGSSP